MQETEGPTDLTPNKKRRDNPNGKAPYFVSIFGACIRTPLNVASRGVATSVSVCAPRDFSWGLAEPAVESTCESDVLHRHADVSVLGPLESLDPAVY
jgi:hypothetical protein